MTNSLLESIAKLRIGEVSIMSLMPIMITVNLGSGIRSIEKASETWCLLFRENSTHFYGGVELLWINTLR